jgi:hypothetical protein
MYISNHAAGFANQWGYAEFVRADDLSESFWVDVADEDVSYDADPLVLLISAEDLSRTA